MTVVSLIFFSTEILTVEFSSYSINLLYPGQPQIHIHLNLKIFCKSVECKIVNMTLIKINLIIQ